MLKRFSVDNLRLWFGRFWICSRLRGRCALRGLLRPLLLENLMETAGPSPLRFVASFPNVRRKLGLEDPGRVAGEVDVLALSNDALEGRGLGRQVLREQLTAGETHW